jgi:uncharacterized protein DUF4193
MVLHEGSECHCANEPHAATTAFVITSLAPPVAVGVHKLGQAAAIRPRASLLVTGSETAKAPAADRTGHHRRAGLPVPGCGNKALLGGVAKAPILTGRVILCPLTTTLRAPRRPTIPPTTRTPPTRLCCPTPICPAELTVRVIPKQADEFTCASCFLVQHRNRLALRKGDQLICADCV